MSRGHSASLHTSDSSVFLQALWAPRVLDWDYKQASTPRLWPGKAEYEDVLEIGGNAVTAAMKHSTRHLMPARPDLTSQISFTGQGNGLTAETNGLANSNPGTPNPDARTAFSAQLDATRASSPALSVSSKSAVEKSKALTPTAIELQSVEIDYVAESAKLPLDVAVFESICQSGAEDKVKRVATNILVVGGVGNLQGVGWALQSRQVVLGRRTT